jgi:hypothetical protein
MMVPKQASEDPEGQESSSIHHHIDQHILCPKDESTHQKGLHVSRSGQQINSVSLIETQMPSLPPLK